MKVTIKTVFSLIVFLNIRIANLSAEEQTALPPEKPLTENSNGTGWSSFMEKLIKANKKIEEVVVESYKAIENGVVTSYKAIEDGVVSGYKKIEKWFTETFNLSDPMQDSKIVNLPNENSTDKSLISDNISDSSVEDQLSEKSFDENLSDEIFSAENSTFVSINEEIELDNSEEIAAR